MLLNAPGWEYVNHPSFSNNLLISRAAQAFQNLRTKSVQDLLLFMKDTRPFHAAFFRDLTPPGFAYFAGHYRGENFPRLIDYVVYIGNYQGCPPFAVVGQMASFAKDIEAALCDLRIVVAAAESVVPREMKLFRIVEVATSVFVKFLEIHPFANGNGHASRFVILSLLGTFGFWHFKLPMHPRPKQPFDHLISRYRAGDRTPLVHYMMQNL